MLEIVDFHYGRTPCIEGDDKLEVKDRIKESEDEEGILFLQETNQPGIYRYGYQTKKDDPIWNHKAGYIWSSRASVMNANFNTRLAECNYRQRGTQTYTSCAIDVDTLESILDTDKYIIVRSEYKNCEINYRVEERIK